VKTEEQYKNDIFMHRIIDAKRIIEEERAKGEISEDDAEYALRIPKQLNIRWTLYIDGKAHK